jgi:ribosome modulation factor
MKTVAELLVAEEADRALLLELAQKAASVDRLSQARIADMLDVAYARGYQAGLAAEREAVCEYLSTHHEGWVPSELVPAIERGEHLPKPRS